MRQKRCCALDGANLKKDFLFVLGLAGQEGFFLNTYDKANLWFGWVRPWGYLLSRAGKWQVPVLTFFCNLFLTYSVLQSSKKECVSLRLWVNALVVKVDWKLNEFFTVASGFSTLPPFPRSVRQKRCCALDGANLKKDFLFVLGLAGQEGFFLNTYDKANLWFGWVRPWGYLLSRAGKWQVPVLTFFCNLFLTYSVLQSSKKECVSLRLYIYIYSINM